MIRASKVLAMIAVDSLLFFGITACKREVRVKKAMTWQCSSQKALRDGTIRLVGAVRFFFVENPNYFVDLYQEHLCD